MFVKFLIHIVVKKTEILGNRKLRIILTSKGTTISGGGRNFYRTGFSILSPSRKDYVGGQVTEARNVRTMLVGNLKERETLKTKA